MIEGITRIPVVLPLAPIIGMLVFSPLPANNLVASPIARDTDESAYLPLRYGVTIIGMLAMLTKAEDKLKPRV